MRYYQSGISNGSKRTNNISANTKQITAFFKTTGANLTLTLFAPNSI